MPNNCTVHGKYVDGKCECDPGWSGDFCDIGKPVYDLSGNQETFLLLSNFSLSYSNTV